MRLGPTVDGSAEGPDASLRSCVRSLLDFFLFLKEITFRYCSSAVDSFLGLHTIGDEALEVYNTLHVPCGDDDISVEDVLMAFKKYCSPLKNLVFE